MTSRDAQCSPQRQQQTKDESWQQWMRRGCEERPRRVAAGMQEVGKRIEAARWIQSMGESSSWREQRLWNRVTEEALVP